MKILLIKPYNLSDHIQPSIGLGYLATACRDKNEVIILDCIKENVTLPKLAQRIRQMKPDLVGFQCYTFDLRFINSALAECKAVNKDIITVIGGPHPSAIPKESFKYFGKNLDFLFVGEAERGLPLLINKLDNSSAIDFSQIPGLGWRKNNEIHINPNVFVDDLDSLGMPAWDLIRPEEYPECQHGAFFRKFPIAPLVMTRGCPFKCSFCAGNIIGGNKIRKHSADFVVEQINYLYQKRGIREFHIIDDNFTFDKNYAKELLKKIINLKLDISWATPNGVRIDFLDEELLNLMKKSGLYLISLGIESGSDRVLALMDKGTTIEKIRKSIDLIHKCGIEIAGFFVLGFPGETAEEIRKTIRFSLELDLVRANYFTYLPFPGTDSYKELMRNKELDNVEWNKFYFTAAPYVPKGLTRKQLKSLQRYAFFRFYLRPSIIFKNLSSVRSLRHFKFLLKRFFHWIVMH